MLYTYQFLFTNPEFPRRFQKRIQKNSKQGFPRGKEYLGSPNGNPCADHLEEWQARYLPGRQAEATKPPEVFHGFQTGKFPSIFQLPGFEGWKVSSTFRKFKKKKHQLPNHHHLFRKSVALRFSWEWRSFQWATPNRGPTPW